MQHTGSPVAMYGELFRLAGPRYAVFGFLGRLPGSMSPVGTLMLVADTSGSYAAGGTSAGALALAGAVATPASGALADRLGQRYVVLAQSLLAATSLVAIVVLSSVGTPWVWQATAAAVAGLFMPPVGPLARARWRPIIDASPTQPRRLVDAAFSYEGAADEASFVVGPAIVGVTTALLSPAALIVAAIMLAIFGSLFATHSTCRLVPGRPRGSKTGSDPLPRFVLLVLAGAQLIIGSVFGAVQAGTSSLATQAGHPGLTGLLHALLGVGSVAAGLAVALIPPRIRHETRLILFAAGLVVLAAPLLAVHGLGTLAVVLLIMGVAIAPYMITVFTLAERRTPQTRTGAMMTLLAGATGLGYAVGSTIAGRLVDVWGYTAAFAVPITAAVLATALVTLASRRLRADGSASLRNTPVDAVALRLHPQLAA